jgi:Glycosyl hydrolase family 71
MAMKSWPKIWAAKSLSTYWVWAAILLILIVGCSIGGRMRRKPNLTEYLYPKVLADYQPWFGDPQHINVGYSTQDPNVLRRQIEQAKSMGIYAFAVDWYSTRRPFLDRSYALLQQAAAQNNFHVCLMYDETEEDNGHATDDALEAMQEAYDDYIGPNAPAHNAYLEYGNRPVIFIFPKRGHTDWDRVRDAVSSWAQPPLFIYKGDQTPKQYAKDFDGYYAWIHPGPGGWQADGSNWGEKYLEAYYEKMNKQETSKIIVGGVWPGFNDSRASWGLNRHMDRRCGQTFDDTLELFREYDNPNHPMPFILIATWNDYEEGTEIEDGISHCGGQQVQRASADAR